MSSSIISERWYQVEFKNPTDHDSFDPLLFSFSLLELYLMNSLKKRRYVYCLLLLGLLYLNYNIYLQFITSRNGHGKVMFKFHGPDGEHYHESRKPKYWHEFMAELGRVADYMSRLG